MAPPNAPVSMWCITTAPMYIGFVAGLRSGLAPVLNSCDLCCVAGVSRAVWGIVAMAASAALCAGLFGRRRCCPSHTGAGVVLFETEPWGMSATAESEPADVCGKAPGRVRRAGVCLDGIGFFGDRFLLFPLDVFCKGHGLHGGGHQKATLPHHMPHGMTDAWLWLKFTAHCSRAVLYQCR